MSGENPLNDPFDSHEMQSIVDVSDLESPSQQVLREAFEAVGKLNRGLLDSFNPYLEDACVDIKLGTAFPEAEAVEPKLASIKRENMLSDLKLLFIDLEPDHSDLIFKTTYDDGQVDQIRFVTRDDGVRIPVLTELGSTEDGNPIEHIQLLSYKMAASTADRLESGLEEYKTDTRLIEELGIDREFLELTDLSFEDKQSMLAAYDKIQGLEVSIPDTEVLNRARRGLVKAMLPGTKFMSLVRSGRLAKAQAEYERGVLGFAAYHGLDTKSTRELLQSEKLRRLQALNEQLQFRQRATKVGLVVVNSAVTFFGTGAGIATGMALGQEMNDGTARAAVIGALLGGGSGICIGIEQGMHLRKQIRKISGFSAEDFDHEDGIASQLNEEQRLAERYVRLLDA